MTSPSIVDNVFQYKGADNYLNIHQEDPVNQDLEPESATQSPSAKTFGLDNTISKIGFGKFQKQMLFLCGLGWLADNMWLQAIAVILPRVQQQFGVTDVKVGLISSSIFFGMMLGSLFWGFFSDRKGRKGAFKWTLVLAGTFGIICSLCPTFSTLCLSLVLLGFGVGGNMPVDGAIFLEFMPKEKKYLLTLLSVFFSFGAVFSSLLAWIIMPPYSCVLKKDLSQLCDIEKDNNGWRYLLFALGTANLGMVAARSVFFHLPESPKFLFNKNRHQDLLKVLRKIVSINGDDMEIELKDVQPYSESKSYETTISNPEANDLQESMDVDVLQKFGRKFDYGVFKKVLNRKYFLSTILVWSIWGLVNLAYTMFNVFLPKYLEEKNAQTTNGTESQTYRSYFLYSLSGLPGAIIGSWLVETALGRRGAMFVSTVLIAVALFLFTISNSSFLVLMSSSSVNFLATITYAVIYAYTPEVFEADVRGTACGIAAAVGRIAGIAAPVLTGLLLLISQSVPIYFSGGLFVLVSVCMALLPFETRNNT